MSQIDGAGFRLIRGRELPQISGNIALSGGQVLGQRRTFLREGAADTHGGHAGSYEEHLVVFMSLNYTAKTFGILKRINKNRCCQP